MLQPNSVSVREIRGSRYTSHRIAPQRTPGSFPFALNRCNPNDDPILRATYSTSIKGVPLEHVEPPECIFCKSFSYAPMSFGLAFNCVPRWNWWIKLWKRLLKRICLLHTMKCSMDRLVTSTSNKTPPCIIQTKITGTLLLFSPCGPHRNQENDKHVASSWAWG